MSPEQQRIKIAEVRGWKPYKPITDEGWPLLMTPPKKPNEEGWLEPIPNYLNDLNAMHEAESTLNLNQWDAYESHLKSITAQAGIYSPIRAAAAQRAEAFLKTLNLWTEE